jgi:hypothetical protein
MCPEAVPLAPSRKVAPPLRLEYGAHHTGNAVLCRGGKATAEKFRCLPGENLAIAALFFIGPAAGGRPEDALYIPNQEE